MPRVPVFALAICALAVLMVLRGAAAQGTTTVVAGAGATLPADLYQNALFRFFRFVDSTTLLTYEAVGSGEGRARLLRREVSFAGSDSPMPDAEHAVAGKGTANGHSAVLTLPMVATAVSMPYNLGRAADAPPLVLDGPTTVAIFLGDVRMWNDARVRALQPDGGLSLPAEPIVLVLRQSKSGTTELFTQGLNGMDAAWQAENGGPGVSASPAWPSSVNAVYVAGQSDMIELITTTPYTIGYASQSAIEEASLPPLTFLDAEGSMLAPELSSVTMALERGLDNDRIDTRDFSADLTNQNGAWPFVGLTYLMFWRTTTDVCSHVVKLVDFYLWVETNELAIQESEAAFFVTMPPTFFKPISEVLGSIGCESTSEVSSRSDVIQFDLFSASGASFPFAAVNRWVSDFNAGRARVLGSYTPTGSGRGKNLISKGTTHFALSDAPLTDEERAENPGLLMLPIIAGAATCVYNLGNMTLPATGNSLRMSMEVLGLIFTGQVTTWNDPAILNENPNYFGLLPAVDITVFVRASASGTTFIFTDALAKASPAFREQVGAGQLPDWPANFVRNSSPHKRVAETPFSISYSAYTSGVSLGLRHVDVPNQAGNFVQPGTSSIGAAFSSFTNDFAVGEALSLAYSADSQAWPFTGLSYVLVPSAVDSTDCSHTQRALEFLIYSQVDPFAAELAREESFATLPFQIRDEFINAIQGITCNGENLELLGGCPLTANGICNGQGTCSALGECVCRNDGKEYDFQCVEITSTGLDSSATLTYSLAGGGFVLVFIAILVGTIVIRRRKEADSYLVPFGEITLSVALGSGGFGTVFLGTFRGQQVAVKQFIFRNVRDASYTSPTGDSTKNPYTISANVAAANMTLMDVQAKTGAAVADDASQDGGDVNMYLSQQNSLLMTHTAQDIAKESGRKAKKSKSNKSSSRKSSSKSRAIMNSFRREVHLLTSLRHPNVVFCLGAAVNNHEALLILEYMTQGSLYAVLGNQDEQITLLQKIEFALDAARGIAFLHGREPPLLHKDIKSLNLLVDERGTVKVADLGLSGFKTKTSFIATVPWASPETLAGKPYTAAADVYSFAIVMWEIMAREPPYKGLKLAEIIRGVRDSGLRPEVPEHAPPKYRDLMTTMWSESPELRPTMSFAVSQLEMMAKEARMEAAAMNKKHDDLLYKAMPKYVIDDLRVGRPVRPRTFDVTTVLFSDIVGFTSMSSVMRPAAVAEMLSYIHDTVFDGLAEYHNVFKFDTIGDAYMAVGGVPEEDPESAAAMCCFALDMVRACQDVDLSSYGVSDRKLEIRIGLHSGPVVGTVVGTTHPKFTLLGDTVNVSSRMESSSRPNKILISSTTAALIAPHCQRAISDSMSATSNNRGNSPSPSSKLRGAGARGARRLSARDGMQMFPSNKSLHEDDMTGSKSEMFILTRRAAIEVKGKGQINTFWLQEGPEFSSALKKIRLMSDSEGDTPLLPASLEHVPMEAESTKTPLPALKTSGNDNAQAAAATPTTTTSSATLPGQVPSPLAAAVLPTDAKGLPEDDGTAVASHTRSERPAGVVNRSSPPVGRAMSSTSPGGLPQAARRSRTTSNEGSAAQPVPPPSFPRR